MTFAQHLARWEELHGVTASPVVVGWLRVVHVVARLLPVPPWVLTLAAVVLAGSTLLVPPRVGALLVVLSALCDGLDGAVAVLRDQVTRLGAVLDGVGDRFSDGFYLVALVLAGGNGWLALACGIGVLVLEGTRLVVRRPVVVTVGERPTRVIATVAGLLVAPSVALSVLAVATAVALLQLGRGLVSGDTRS